MPYQMKYKLSYNKTTLSQRFSFQNFLRCMNSGIVGLIPIFHSIIYKTIAHMKEVFDVKQALRNSVYFPRFKTKGKSMFSNNSSSVD